MSGIIAILLAYYMYSLIKGLIIFEGPWTISNYIIIVIIILMAVAFVFTVKKAILENRARKEEQAQLRAQYERKRAEKVRQLYVEDFEDSDKNDSASN